MLSRILEHSIPLENVRKPEGFLKLSGGVECCRILESIEIKRNIGKNWLNPII